MARPVGRTRLPAGRAGGVFDLALHSGQAIDIALVRGADTAGAGSTRFECLGLPRWDGSGAVAHAVHACVFPADSRVFDDRSARALAPADATDVDRRRRVGASVRRLVA